MRMVRGALGTNNVDHCTRLCHSSSVSAMNRALATAAASGSMREIEEACDVIFISGANTTETHPVFGALIKRAVKKGAKLIVADVRRTELAQMADIHLQMMPGTDVVLYNSMLQHIVASGLTDEAFIRDRTHGWEPLKASLHMYRPEVAERITGVPAATIRAAAEMYARGPRTSTLWAMGLTQHSTGTDIVASLLNVMLACGMIGRWGCAMIPIRGQNNVQGASDVGAIPFAYTDYRPVEDPAVRKIFADAWHVPEESLSLKRGMMVTEIVADGSPIRGLFIMGENPVLSDPNIAHAEHWVRGLEFLGVQDLFLTETARWADVVLPGSSFAEKEGTVINTDRHIQLMEPAMSPPGEARCDLDILIDLSNRLGLKSDYTGEGSKVVFSVVGRRGNSTMQFRGEDVLHSYVGFTDRPSFANAREISQDLIQGYIDGELDRVDLVYNRYVSPLTQYVRRQTLLPLEAAEVYGEGLPDPEEPADEDLAEAHMKGSWFFEPEPEELLPMLFEEYASLSVYRALLESAASEHGARMTAMRNAAENAQDMISSLTLEMNRVRQAEITQEILEVVAGAEALG